MIELPLVLLSGLLGSSHCVGMCGPFALAIGAASETWPRNLGRQLIYGMGRIFTYSFLGACAGYGGLVLTDRFGTWTHVPAILSIVAGLFLVAQGLQAGGLFHTRIFARLIGRELVNQGTCLSGSLLAGFLRDRRRRGVFLAGLLTGLLPCGLVYAFLAMAASAGSVARGLLTMTAFGIGTLPIMVATGCGGALLGGRSRARMMKVAACAVVLAGLLCVARGVGFLPSLWGAPAASCPLCLEQ